MKKIACLTFLASTALFGQDALSNEARQVWNRVKGNLIGASEKMDEANYTFAPTPESQSFKVLIAHTADSAMGACSGYNGEAKKLGAAAMATKAELVAALQSATAECDKAYSALTDANATEMIEVRGAKRSRIGALYGNTIHMEHEYAQMAVLMRLKGVVPPSSDRKK